MYIGFFVVSNFYGGGAPKEAWEASEDDGHRCTLWWKGVFASRILLFFFFLKGWRRLEGLSVPRHGIPLNRSLLFTDFDSASMYGFRTFIAKLCFVTKRGK